MTQSYEPTITEMNEAIALFDGWVIEKRGQTDLFIKENDIKKGCRFRGELKYHTSWDWLMPVVAKIEAVENKRFGVCIDVLDTMVMDYKVGEDQGEKIVVQADIYPDNGDTKISITHTAIYQFITWYNQQTSTYESKSE